MENKQPKSKSHIRPQTKRLLASTIETDIYPEKVRETEAIIHSNTERQSDAGAVARCALSHSRKMGRLKCLCFRLKRSTHDAIEQCFKALAKVKSSSWILEGDIKSCFDRISHDWLLQNIPMDKTILRKFLKAASMENGRFNPTYEGMPQGGLVSPTLAVMALSGLEPLIVSPKERQRRKDKINMIAYADDFVVTATSKELIEEKVLPTLVAALRKVWLELSPEKTKITHIEKGFDFPGFNARKYVTGKLLIKPSKASVTGFLEGIKYLIKKGGALPTDKLIHSLNARITGWTNYYRNAVASKTFSQIDSQIFLALKRWGFKRQARIG